MRANEFIIEGPVAPVSQDKEQIFKQVWNHEFEEPGNLWDDHGYDRPEDIENPFTIDNKLRHVGTGAEAAVVRYDDANSVFKIIGTYQQLGQNAHLQYLLATKKYAGSNPYLPRILSFNEVPQISGKNKSVKGYAVRMERLFPFDTSYKGAATPEMEIMLQKIFGPDFVSYMENTNHFTRYIKYAINGKLAYLVIDPQFKQAAELIIAVAKQMDSQYDVDTLIDLHIGNIMIRPTKFGPQLVLSDPLYNGGEHLRTSS
jgi:hypothetical protein